MPGILNFTLLDVGCFCIPMTILLLLWAGVEITGKQFVFQVLLL
jgi:hypothetical protein